MKFGLFGGARTEMGEQASDSRIYTDYIDYICEAEALGFHSVFLVEHHFTGFGQISATLNFLTYLAAKTTTIAARHRRAWYCRGTTRRSWPSRPRRSTCCRTGASISASARAIAGASSTASACRWRRPRSAIRRRSPFCARRGPAEGRFSHHGKYWHYDDVVIEPAPVQKPHPPLWVGAQSPNSIRYAAENGFNLLLGQAGSPDVVAEGIGVYRRAVEAQGRVFDPMTVGLTRALHIAYTPEEREAAHELRMKFMRNVQQLSLSPTGESPTLGRPRRFLSREEMHKATESDALIGPPEEIVGRLKRLEAGGVELCHGDRCRRLARPSAHLRARGDAGVRRLAALPHCGRGRGPRRRRARVRASRNTLSRPRLPPRPPSPAVRQRGL